MTSKSTAAPCADSRTGHSTRSRIRQLQPRRSALVDAQIDAFIESLPDQGLVVVDSNHASRNTGTSLEETSITAKNIPVPIKNRPQRTTSELEILEASIVADWRDLSMCQRLVAGMRKRQQQLHQARQYEQFAHPTKYSSRNDASTAHSVCLLQTDRCVENIIQTRRSSFVEIDDDCGPSDSFGNFVTIEGYEDAPPPTITSRAPPPPRLPSFPNLASANDNNIGATRLFPRVDGNAEGGQCFEGVFDLDE